MGKDNTLLLLSEDLHSLQEGLTLEKSKGNREGLVQQIITYVRDGRTITRKQWVRSEFAQHAKKNEEQKRLAELKSQRKEDNKHTKKLEEENAKKKSEDRRAYKKKKAHAEDMGTKAKPKKVVSDLDKKRKKLGEKRSKEEKEKKEKNISDRKKNERKEETVKTVTS